MKSDVLTQLTHSSHCFLKRNTDFFSHPDFTVGFGIELRSHQISHISMGRGLIFRITAGRESHPTPKNLPSFIFFLQDTIMQQACQVFLYISLQQLFKKRDCTLPQILYNT